MSDVRPILVEPAVWEDPLLRDKRLVLIDERIGQHPVRAQIRQDAFGQLCDLFETSISEERYLIEPRLARLKRLLTERFRIESFHSGNHWQLLKKSEFSHFSSPHVGHLTDNDVPAIRQAFRRDGLTRNPSELLEFDGCYGYFLEDELVSWANIVDGEGTDSVLVNVYTLREEREHGYGTAVVSACVEAVLSRGRTAWCTTDIDNFPMNAICQKLGFHKAAEDFEAIEDTS